jgi:hypothetical protein
MSPIISSLPHLNAALNATATVLLVTGWLLIKRRRIQQHRAVMIAAVITSAAFLTSYRHLPRQRRLEAISRHRRDSNGLLRHPDSTRHSRGRLAAADPDHIYPRACGGTTSATGVSRDGRCRCGCTYQ